MSFITRSRILKPSSLCSWTRALATEATATTTNATSASREQASDLTNEPTPSTSKAVELPTTPPPTPYHPFVHVPLMSLTSKQPLLDSTTQEPLIVPLPSPLFNTPSRPSLLHRLVVAHLASLRQGTSANKNRSQVQASGKKIRPQKGTGKARLGSRGSPMLRGGGNAFAKQPKGPDGWSLKVNRKEERLGLRVGLSDKWRQGRLNVVDRLAMQDASTRVLKQSLQRQDWLDSLFIVANGQDRDAQQIAFELSSGNLTDVAVVSEIEELGVWDIVKHKNVVIEMDALDELIYRLDPDLAQDLELLDIAEEEEFDMDSLTPEDETVASSVEQHA